MNQVLLKTCFLFLFLITAGTGYTFAQTGTGKAVPSPMQKTIRAHAEKMGRFLFDKNYTGFAQYTYPKILEMMGGAANMAKAIEDGNKEMAEHGMSITKVTIGEPSAIITAGNELQCTVPQTIEMKTPEGRLVAHSTLIAISSDGGKTWHFLDTSRKPLKALQQFIPNLSNDLVIPEKEEPVMLKD